MEKLWSSKIFNLILLITIIGEFLLPFILKFFYLGYDSKKMVMSVLGNPKSPVKIIYNIWHVWLGIFLLLTSFVFFSETEKTSLKLAVLTSVSISVFAVGAGILSGIFGVNESKDVVTAASQIHGFGSAIGFMALLFYPLLSSIAAFRNNDFIQGTVCVSAFIIAVVFFTFFIMGDKEKFKETVFSYAGLWERLCLFFMYVPFLY
ncbi:MAG: DUF998 domain-containing protein, partial [Oscillospiraceae bacterium]|nr:DUF998 domain-containing protein [Oscillospiraceae bacterium]